MEAAPSAPLLGTRDEAGQLISHLPGIGDRLAHGVGVKCRAAPMARDLALDEPAERHADRDRPKARPVGGPGVIADLDASHAVPRRPSSVLRQLLPVPFPATHVYTVDRAADTPKGVQLCAKRRAAP